MANRVEVICRKCKQKCTVTPARAAQRNYICRACNAGLSRRTYAEQVNPQTDLEWQPKGGNPNRPPAKLLQEQRQRAELGLPLTGYKIPQEEDIDDD